ncbi:MAG TPA: helix-turn-helix domain-containing protein, partial [Nitrospirales bacterium]|nr:helix-turn-helix domain-containing protein [Nitrospirales bacterium]
SDLPAEITGTVPDDELRAAGILEADSGFVTLEEMEKRYLMRVLRETGGNKMKAAKLLGIDRRTLYRMAERFGLELGDDSDMN